MADEFRKRLENFACEQNVRSFGDNNNQLQSEFKEEDFKNFLIEIQILPRPEKNSVKKDADSLFKKILRILTPSHSKKPIISSRNALALFFAIFNTQETWMDK